MLIDDINPKRITLYDMRMASGKTGSSITRLCGITYRSLRNWEKGTALPNIVNVHDLLQIYGYSYYELDFTPLYKGTNQDEKQKRIDAAAIKRTAAGTPQRFLSLKGMRQQSGFSAATVAKLCGVTYRSIRNWEEGKSIPNVTVVNDLLTIYGYSFYEMDFAFVLRKIRGTFKEKEGTGRTDRQSI